MEQKQRLFIYDRKEMIVLVLLGVMVAVFAFTLGVHLGKALPEKSTGALAGAPPLAATVPDQLPNRQELTEQAKSAPQVADETLNQSLHDEVTTIGMKLETPRQVDLPRKTRSANGGATAGSTADILNIAAAQRVAPDGKFTLQIGSYPNLVEAKDQVDSMEALGLKPWLREAQVKGKGRWFRVFLGGFTAKDEAEQAGQRYRTRHMIESYIVSKIES